MIPTRVIGLMAIAVVATPGPLHGQEPSLATVMERAGGYATTFQRQLSNIVAEERYVQDITRMNLPPGRFATESHRQLRSDVLPAIRTRWRRARPLLDTMTTYYVLAYQPPAHEKPGYRRIKVEVRAKGLQVRARRGYFSGAPVKGSR
jgi:hypothetical protein